MAKARRNLAFLVLLLLVPAALNGQEGYKYRRAIDSAPQGWARIVLPDDVYEKLGSGLFDLRILGTDAAHKQFEVPYSLRQPAPRSSTAVNFTLINRTSVGDRYFYTFDTAKKERINRIELKFARPNFDRLVLLEGSQDLTGWQVILKDYRIVSVRNGAADFEFSSLRFPIAAFRYYRVSFSSDTDPGDLSALIYLIETTPGAVRNFPITAYYVSPDRKNKQTKVDIRLTNKVPVSQVLLKTEDGPDFFRQFRVSYRTGTDKTGRDLFSEAGSGVVSSVASGPFEFPEVLTDRLLVTVEDGDNEPLTYKQPEVGGRPYEILAKFPNAGSYELVYSNKDASRPDYDIGHFVNKAPADVPTLALGPEQALSSSGKSLSEVRWPLWVTMAVVIVLMLWFAFRLLKKQN